MSLSMGNHRLQHDLIDKKKEVVRQEERLEDLRGNVDALVEKVKLCEAMVEYFKDTGASDRERVYFELIVDLKYENGKLRQENEVLKTENRTLRAKLEKAYDFMRQFTIGGMNMLEKFFAEYRRMGTTEGGWNWKVRMIGGGEGARERSLLRLWVVTLLSSRSVRNINHPLCGCAVYVIQKNHLSVIMRLFKPIYNERKGDFNGQ